MLIVYFLPFVISLPPSSKFNFPPLPPSHAITSHDFCPISHSARPFPSPPLISLIVLFSYEGYSCLQGYENVREAHSIFSYVNSHFPPEQTHFPASDLPRYTSQAHRTCPTSSSNTWTRFWGSMTSECCRCPLHIRKNWSTHSYPCFIQRLLIILHELHQSGFRITMYFWRYDFKLKDFLMTVQRAFDTRICIISNQ